MMREKEAHTTHLIPEEIHAELLRLENRKNLLQHCLVLVLRHVRLETDVRKILLGRDVDRPVLVLVEEKELKDEAAIQRVVVRFTILS